MPKKRLKLPDAVTLDLRGRQSVRATFKLSAKAIDSLSLVSVHLGIKQKSLFDHLIDDAASLRDLARRIQMGQFNKMERVQKTFVLSRRTLDVLESISRDQDTPRDALVEYSIKRLEEVISLEQEKHEKRKKFFQEMSAHWEEGRILLQKARDVLGEDDPFCRRVERVQDISRRTREELGAFMEKSRLIENY